MIDRIRKNLALCLSFRRRKMTQKRSVRAKNEKSKTTGRSKKLPKRMPEVKSSKA